MNSEPLISAQPAFLEHKAWVWSASDGSKKASKVSVLACAETAFAIVLYWWIAIKWDTHWHLLTSVFIAPLLLLKSRESIDLGINLFFKDWLGLGRFAEWSFTRKFCFFSVTCLVVGYAAYEFINWLAGYLFFGQMWWRGVVAETLFLGATWLVLSALVMMFWSMFVGFPDSFSSIFFIELISSIISINLVSWVALAATGLVFIHSGVGLDAFCRAWCIYGGIRIALRKLNWSEIVGFVDTIPGSVGFGIGIGIRALISRIASTLIKLPKGIVCIPHNWKETIFCVDSFILAELMPGIRDNQNDLTLDGWISSRRHVKSLHFKNAGIPIMGLIMFVPVICYRLNLKATSWFWWPISYLLEPVPKTDKVTQQKQSLCWPWDNPMQKSLILVPALVVLALIIYQYCDPAAWAELKSASAVPIPLKLILGMEWSYIPPWHWALVIVEVAGIGMLWIAGNASSHKKNDNWEEYAQSGMKWDLVLMQGLTRVRSLAAIAFMLLGLGACLISFPEWQKHLPETIVHRLEKFYRTHELREQERLMHRASEALDATGKETPKPKIP